MQHRHIKEGYEDTIEAVEDVLERGSVGDWRELASKIKRDPYGAEAQAVDVVLDHRHIYGTGAMWKMFLRKCRMEISEIVTPNLTG